MVSDRLGQSTVYELLVCLDMPTSGLYPPARRRRHGATWHDDDSPTMLKPQSLRRLPGLQPGSANERAGQRRAAADVYAGVLARRAGHARPRARRPVAMSFAAATTSRPELSGATAALAVAGRSSQPSLSSPTNRPATSTRARRTTSWRSSRGSTTRAARSGAHHSRGRRPPARAPPDLRCADPGGSSATIHRAAVAGAGEPRELLAETLRSRSSVSVPTTRSRVLTRSSDDDRRASVSCLSRSANGSKLRSSRMIQRWAPTCCSSSPARARRSRLLLRGALWGRHRGPRPTCHPRPADQSARGRQVGVPGRDRGRRPPWCRIGELLLAITVQRRPTRPARNYDQSRRARLFTTPTSEARPSCRPWVRRLTPGSVGAQPRGPDRQVAGSSFTSSA